MSRKRTAALVAALGINFALAGGALFLANLNKPADFDSEAGDALSSKYADIKQVAGVAFDKDAGDMAVPLVAAQRGGNTRVTFSCAKKTPAGREIHEGTWNKIAGAVLYRPEQKKLLAVEAVFDTRSLQTDARGLTNTVTVKEKWFDYENHPTATFKCNTVKPVDAATTSHTHDLVGTFTLNGITKDLTIPAKLTFTGQSVKIDARFTILRSDYKVDKRDSSIAGAAGGVVSRAEDNVDMAVKVNASPDPTAVLGELAKALQDQQEQLRVAAIERKQLAVLRSKLEALEFKTDQLASGGLMNRAAVDTSKLPKRFVDQAEGNSGMVPFNMVLVPGDEAKGVKPFYMATHEVAWRMIDLWMYTTDLKRQGKSAGYISDQIKKELRPSPLYAEPAQMIGVQEDDRSAIAMSRLTATAYCKWLSEKTGRRYRLPTLKEWRHAMKLGGGLPKDLDKHAWHEGNHEINRKTDDPYSSPPGLKLPNKLGIYDMFGNAAEWVIGTGTERTVVGGGFLTPADEITEDWTAVENIDVWSESYPQFPFSKYWYTDFYHTGIRLVCEPASVAKNPPKPVKTKEKAKQ